MVAPRGPAKADVTYIDYLIKLRDVHRESHTDQPNGKEIDGILENQNAMAFAIRHAPTSEKIAAMLGNYSKNGLFLYEAFSRLSQTEKATQCLDEFSKRFNVEVKKTIGLTESDPDPFSNLFGSFFHGRPTSQRINTPTPQHPIGHYVELFNTFCRDLCVVPEFKGGRWIAVLNKINLLGKQALLQSRNAPPTSGDQARFMINSALSFSGIPPLEHQVIISIYEKEIIRYSAREILGQNAMHMSDEGIQSLLSVCGELQEIDLSGCIKISVQAFRDGPFEKIRKVFLNNTPLSSDLVLVKKMFPNAKDIVNNEPRSVYGLNIQSLDSPGCYNREGLRLVSSEDWETFAEKIKKATDIEIKSTTNPLKGLLASFVNSPIPEAFTALFTFIENQHKIIGGYKILRPELLEACLNAWQREGTFDPDKETCREELTTYLTQAWKEETTDAEFDKVINAIGTAFVKITTSSCRYGSEILRLKTLLIALRAIPGGYNERWINTALDRLTTLLAKSPAAWEKSNWRQEIENNLQIVIELSYGNHKFTEESQIKLSKTLASFAESTSVDVLPQIVASAFLVNFQNVAHYQTLLERICSAYSDIPVMAFYPLLQLMVGSINDNNIPERERSSLLAQRAKAYKGVFSNPDLSKKFKDSLLKDLCEGKIGGKIPELVEALAILINRPELDMDQKRSIRVTLRSFRDIEPLAKRTSEILENLILVS